MISKEMYLKELEKLNNPNSYNGKFGTNYFGADICNKTFINTVKIGEYPDWLIELLSNKNSYDQHYVTFKIVTVDGCSGGNCWGGDAEYFDDGSEDVLLSNKDFESKFKLDINSIPSYNFQECITEYYGNYTNFEYHFVLTYDIIMKTSRVAKIENVLKNE